MGLLPRGSRPKPETEINQTAWNNHAVPYVTQLGAILTGQDKRENQDGEKRLLLLSTDLIIIHVSLIDILIVILLFFFFFRESRFICLSSTLWFTPKENRVPQSQGDLGLHVWSTSRSTNPGADKTCQSKCNYKEKLSSSNLCSLGGDTSKPRLGNKHKQENG